ncbi:MAG: hypothetical protein ACOVQ0_01655 [Novosphingobium sp.]|jgi:hypothetical protein
MTTSPETRVQSIDRAIALAEAALIVCDELGLLFPAIDLSSAIDKLQALRETPEKD